MDRTFSCWCGEHSLEDFSPDYSWCLKCNTLISKVVFDKDTSKVTDDDQDLYGKEYWLSRQKQKYGHPDIFERVNSDLSDRCLYWLQAILKYKLPPAKTLELGSSHGGFVALLTQLGYNAEGLELSPWIAEFAKNSFDIPMRVGPIEDQAITPASMDMIILMDVLEHLPDPRKTIAHCFTLLKEDGILVIQTPNYPIGKSYAEMKEEAHPFITQLLKIEHIFLFNHETIQTFLSQLTDQPLFIQFEPAIFSQYDMFLFVSKKPFVAHTNTDIQFFLNSNRQNRLIAAALMVYAERNRYIQLFQSADTDRILRLQKINELAEDLQTAKNEINRLSSLNKNLLSALTKRLLTRIKEYARMLFEKIKNRIVQSKQL